MAGQVVEVATRRRHVHEAKQRGPQPLVVGGQLHAALVQCPQRMAGGGGHRGRQLATDLKHLLVRAAGHWAKIASR